MAAGSLGFLEPRGDCTLGVTASELHRAAQKKRSPRKVGWRIGAATATLERVPLKGFPKCSLKRFLKGFLKGCPKRVS